MKGTTKSMGMDRKSKPMKYGNGLFLIPECADISIALEVATLSLKQENEELTSMVFLPQGGLLISFKPKK